MTLPCLAFFLDSSLLKSVQPNECLVFPIESLHGNGPYSALILKRIKSNDKKTNCLESVSVSDKITGFFGGGHL